MTFLRREIYRVSLLLVALKFSTLFLFLSIFFGMFSYEVLYSNYLGTCYKTNLIGQFLNGNLNIIGQKIILLQQLRP